MHFAILTSGGDGPGMNASIRAFTRHLLFHKHQVTGIYRGYAGLLNEEFVSLGAAEVGNIIQKGGTILKSSRCPEFHQKKFRKIAYDVLKKHHIQGLCVMGGDGSFRGAQALYEEYQIPIVGIPGTIDNDISATEYTIGHETAVQNAIEAIDKIRDSALSHDRVFFVEVMGKSSASLCQRIAVCTGAEMAILPGIKTPDEDILKLIRRGEKRGKKSSIFIVAENDLPGRAYEIQQLMNKKHRVSSHVCILGHIQRGGSPVAKDRFFATQMGALAAESLMKNKSAPQVTVVQSSRVKLTQLTKCLKKEMRDDPEVQQLLSTLSF